MNEFYGHFDQNNTPVTAIAPTSSLQAPFVIHELNNCTLFRQQDSRKDAGPDGICSTLGHWAD